MKSLIVRRALSPAYYFFLQTFADANRIAVVIDRRVDERRRQTHRTFGERRKADRRGATPMSWSEGDFIVVRAPERAAGAAGN
jgi:hypothetical protein